MPPGYTRLQAGALGYAPVERQVDISPGEDVRITLRLQPSAVVLDSIETRTAGDGARVSGAALERRGRSLAEALDGWQGLAIIRRDAAGGAEPQAPGGGPEDLQVTLDGFPLNDPLTGRADLSRLATRDIQQVTFAPGVQTTAGGGRGISGVLAITTRPRLSPAVSAWAGSYEARGARVALGGGIGSAALTAEQFPRGFPYDVPSGGEASRANAAGSLYRIYARSTGSWEALIRASASGRGLPGTSTNPTPGAHADRPQRVHRAHPSGDVRRARLGGMAACPGSGFRSAARVHRVRCRDQRHRVLRCAGVESSGRGIGLAGDGPGERGWAPR